MRKYINIAWLAVLTLGVMTTACDKINLDEVNNTVSISSNKKVLIEDFTGHTCVNCPGAHDELHKLMETYGDTNLFAVAIHTGSFSTPTSSPPFSYNFQTEVGNAYNNEFKPQAFPSGMVNRRAIDDNILQGISAWGGIANDMFAEIAPLNIKVEITSVSNSRTISGKVDLSFIDTFNQKAKMHIIITEDSIIKPQLTHHGVDESYVHMHVMRGAVNGNWGQDLPNATYATNTTESFSFENYPIGEDWKLKDLHILAYVYDATTKEIIQVNGTKVIP